MLFAEIKAICFNRQEHIIFKALCYELDKIASKAPLGRPRPGAPLRYLTAWDALGTPDTGGVLRNA